jgi:glutathione S-transferase
VLAKSAYVNGKSFTVADAYAYTVLRWAPYTGFDMNRWPHIQSYMARMGARPAVQKVLAEEGLK